MAAQDKKKKLKEENSLAYICIACGDPSDTGQMEVNMTYHGDPDLISYLLSGAQSVIDQQDPDLECEC